MIDDVSVWIVAHSRMIAFSHLFRHRRPKARILQLIIFKRLLWVTIHARSSMCSRINCAVFLLSCTHYLPFSVFAIDFESNAHAEKPTTTLHRMGSPKTSCVDVSLLFSFLKQNDQSPFCFRHQTWAERNKARLNFPYALAIHPAIATV